MLNPLARVAQQYKLEKTKEENITKRKIFDLTEKLAYAVARYSKESQINILKAIAVKEGELGSFIANRVAKLLNLNLFEKTADITVTIPEEIEKFFRGIKKFIKIAQDDDEGHERPVKPMESVELRKIVAKSIEASLDPLVVVAKLKEIAKADPSFAALFDQYPKRTFNSAMMLLQTYPWLIDRPALLASLVKRMTSHSGLEPSELITIGHKSLKTDPFIESVVKSAEEDPSGNQKGTGRRLSLEDRMPAVPDWLRPILSHSAEISPWLLSGIAGAFTNPLTATALGVLGYGLNRLYGPDDKDRWVWPQLANLLPFWYAALLLRDWAAPISRRIPYKPLRRLLLPAPESVPYDVSLSGLTLEKLSPEWREPPASSPSRLRRTFLWPSDIGPALRILENTNFLEMDFPKEPATKAPGHQWIFGTIAETLRNYKNAFHDAINAFSEYEEELRRVRASQQPIGNSPDSIPSRLKISMYDAIQTLTTSTAFSNRPTTRGIIEEVYRRTFDGIAEERQVRASNLPQTGTIVGNVSKLIIERPANNTIKFTLQLHGGNTHSVSEVLNREVQLFERDVFENYGQIKREYPMLDALFRDIRLFEQKLGLIDIDPKSLPKGSELKAAYESLSNIRQNVLDEGVKVSLDRFRILGALEHHYGQDVLRTALNKKNLPVGKLIHPQRLMVSHHPTYAKARAAKSGLLPLLIAFGAGITIPSLVSSWRESENRPPPQEEKKPGIGPAGSPLPPSSPFTNIGPAADPSMTDQPFTSGTKPR